MKRIYKLHLNVLLLMFLVIFIQCKKDSGSLNITLYDKDSSTTKNYIQGIWKLRYHSVGSCGNCVFDQDSNHIIYSFSGNRIKISGNNKPSTDTIFVFTTYKGNSLDYQHNLITYYEGVVPVTFEAYSIKNDTLIFATPLVGGPDSHQSFLTKSN